ncbi:hypothetical protein BGV40_13790 [Methanosarcina sp. Ant1]|nr:hypothetical protein BGV40_13790 [Methanosarcina sp. Ant1]
MPQIGQKIALISPLTYGNDMIEYAYTGKSLFSPLLDIGVLVIFILVLQITANYLSRSLTNEWDMLKSIGYTNLISWPDLIFWLLFLEINKKDGLS